MCCALKLPSVLISGRVGSDDNRSGRMTMSRVGSDGIGLSRIESDGVGQYGI